MTVTKYLIINESTFKDSVSSEVVSLWSTYNKALQELGDIANSFGMELGEDESSIAFNKNNEYLEYFVQPMNEDESS